MMKPQPMSRPPLRQLKIPGTSSLLSHMLNIPSQFISLWLRSVFRSGCFPRSNFCSGGWSLWDSSCLVKPRAERCEVNASYHLRENRYFSGSQCSPLQIHSIHHFHLTHLCNGHNSWYLQKSWIITLICFVPNCACQQLQGMLNFHFYFFTMKFSSKKLVQKKILFLLAKKLIALWKSILLNSSFHGETEGLGVVLYPMCPSKNEQYTHIFLKAASYWQRKLKVGLRL